MNIFDIETLAGFEVADVATVTTYRIQMPDVPFSIDLQLFDSGDSMPDLRFSFEAHIADPELVALLGKDAPGSLCFGNSASSKEVAFATLHWKALKDVIALMKARDI